jgi:hypothetical protein
MKKYIRLVSFSLFLFMIAVNFCVAQDSSASSDTVGAVLAFLIMIPMFLVSVLPFFIFAFTFLLIPLALGFWIWMIVDVVKNEQKDEQLVWVLVVVLAQFIGAAIYFFVRKLPRDKENKKQVQNQKDVIKSN